VRFAEGQVRCDDHVAGFIPLGDQLEEQGRGRGVEREVADLVEDQQPEAV
jgi:hypothetical protein